MIHETTLENESWTLVKPLPANLFSDNYLYKNDNDKYIVMKEINSRFTSIITSNDYRMEDLLGQAEIQNKNYLKVISKVRDLSSNGINWRIYVESAPFCFIDLIKKTKNGRFDEKVAKFFFCQLINVFEELKENSVNFINFNLDDIYVDDFGTLKISDCCISNAVVKSYENLDWIKNFSQKNSHFAPEIVNNQILSENSEIFNLGVVLFSMVTGHNRPYRDFTQNDKIYNHLINSDYTNFWKDINKTLKIDLSKELKQLIFYMLTPDYFSRPSLQEIKEHDWVKYSDNDEQSQVESYALETIYPILKKSAKILVEQAIIPISKPKNYSYGKFPVFRSSNLNNQEKDLSNIFIFVAELIDALGYLPPISKKDLAMNYNYILFDTSNNTNDLENAFFQIGLTLVGEFDYKINKCLTTGTNLIQFKYKTVEESNENIFKKSDDENEMEYNEFELLFYNYKDKFKEYLLAEFVNISMDSDNMNCILQKVKNLK
jgi:serine/threonine protein kinase